MANGAVPSQDGMVMPIHVYGHGWGCSITGGIVYRGTAIPALSGRYFFADYCGGVIEGLRYANGEASELVNVIGGIGGIGNVTSFGTDADGEMLVMNDTGMVFRMIPG